MNYPAGDETDGTPTNEPHGVLYASRLISCPVCNEQVQTAKMQLFTPLGFRYVSCSGCEKQRWSRGWLCECGVAWHTCTTHRMDPAIHRSAKPPKRKVDQAKAERSYKDSERPAPDAVQSVNLQPLKRAKGTRKIHAHGPATHDPAMPRAEAMRISEKWRLRLEARKGNEQPPPDDLLGGSTTGTPAGGSVWSSLAQVRPKGGGSLSAEGVRWRRQRMPCWY